MSLLRNGTIVCFKKLLCDATYIIAVDCCLPAGIVVVVLKYKFTSSSKDVTSNPPW